MSRLQIFNLLSKRQICYECQEQVPTLTPMALFRVWKVPAAVVHTTLAEQLVFMKTLRLLSAVARRLHENEDSAEMKMNVNTVTNCRGTDSFRQTGINGSLRDANKFCCPFRRFRDILFAAMMNISTICTKHACSLVKARISQQSLPWHISALTHAFEFVIHGFRPVSPTFAGVTLFKPFTAKAQLQHLQAVLGYCFQSEELLNKAVSLEKRDYQALAYLGDAAVHMLFREEALRFAMKNGQPDK